MRSTLRAVPANGDCPLFRLPVGKRFQFLFGVPWRGDGDFLRNPAVFHDDDPVGMFRDLPVVRHHDDGSALGVQALEDSEHFRPALGIQVAGGFIGENDRRIVDQGVGDGHPLLLAAGELAGRIVEPVRQPDRGECLGGTILCVFRVLVGVDQRQHHVLDGRRALEKMELLEHRS